MSSVAQSDRDDSSQAPNQLRNRAEAEEEAEGGARPGPRKNRVKIARDRDEIPAVRDETGEKVKEMFEHFLEE